MKVLVRLLWFYEDISINFGIVAIVCKHTFHKKGDFEVIS